MPVGEDWYALDAQSVREVIAWPPVTALPHAPDTVLGLFNLRGEIVPLFDTAALLRLGRPAAWPFAAVVRTGLGPAGLSVSGIPESVELGEPAPSDEPDAEATYAIGARVATFVDVDGLLGVPGWTSGPVTDNRRGEPEAS